MTAADGFQECYRHPDRRAGVSCQRCGRPICPSCMTSASVGFHCPECARHGRQKVYTAQSLRVRARAWATYGLIAVNVAAFVVTVATSGGPNALFQPVGGIFDDGALRAFPIAEDGEWWRLVTSGFLHIGPFHLAMNMYALYILGDALERALGRSQFLVLYVTSLVAGSLGALILDPNINSAGASGAIYGLMGAALAGQRASGVSVTESGLIYVLLLNLVITFGLPGISIGGHLGGLAGGFIGGWLLFDVAPRLKDRWMAVAGCAAVGVACVVAALYVAANPMT